MKFNITDDPTNDREINIRSNTCAFSWQANDIILKAKEVIFATIEPMNSCLRRTPVLLICESCSDSV